MKLFTSCIFLCFALNLHAQQSMNTSGGIAIGAGGTVSYSIGQVFFQSKGGTGGTAKEGVQHPYEIYTVGELENLPNLIQLNVFPNPTQDVLQLQFKGEISATCSYQLLDAQGKLIEQKSLQSELTTLWMQSYASGIYFIKVLEGDRQLKSFKVIKN